MNRYYQYLSLIVMSLCTMTISADQEKHPADYYRSLWDSVHFSPSINSATNEQCLSCHQEIIDRKVRTISPAGVKSESALAWYQTLTTYEGSQETFHRRHLITPLAKKLMKMKCTTCHQGENPREEAVIPPDITNKHFTLRKSVNPEVCLMCHGAFPDYKRMGLPSHWNTSRDLFQNNCLLCHNGVRTNRHQVNFLNPEAIETSGKENSDVCFGCHGGRQWYRISNPYPRHSWPGMAKETPEWAKGRPTESNPRFQIKQHKVSNK